MTMEGPAGRASDSTVDTGAVDARPSPISWCPFSIALWSTLAVGLPLAAWCLVHLDLSAMPRQQLWSLGLLGVLVVIGETRPLIASKTYGQGGVTPRPRSPSRSSSPGDPSRRSSSTAWPRVVSDLIERKIWWKTVFNIGQYTVSHRLGLARAARLRVAGLARRPCTRWAAATSPR